MSLVLVLISCEEIACESQIIPCPLEFFKGKITGIFETSRASYP